MQWLKWLMVVIVVVPVLLILAGQAGLLTGSAPADLGVRDGKLKALSNTPNCVSSQAALTAAHPMRAYAQIAPLAAKGDAAATMAAVKAVVEGMAGAVVVTASADYLYARYTTKLLKFVDDVEFWFDPQAQVVQVRSASRIGHGDRGVNRARVEAIRQQLAAR
jgi:uncharacterized protein (DUF1499 family)